MLTTLLDGNNVNLLIALLGGFITFFASCLLPLVPTYLAFLAGHAITHNNVKDRWHTLKVATAFVGGFITTFIVVGFILNRFALLLGPYRMWLSRAGGVLFIVMGLFILGAGKKSILQREFKLEIPARLQQWRLFYAWLTGLAFGFGWTPCIGPVLAVILFWSTQQATALYGFLLLVAYGIGLGIPFLLVAVAFESLIPWLKKSQRFTHFLQFFAGVFILITGVLMVFNQFQGLSFWLLELLNLSIFTS